MKVRPRSGLHFLLANPSTSPATVLAQPSVYVEPAPGSSRSSPSTASLAWENHCLGTPGPLQTSSNIWIFGIFTAKILPALPPVPGKLSPQSCELLP